ncbi:DUF3892 domain-containing protein [uncultured Clostridium sp.]|uniref:DUF3892 domain-containing protein n=1 Tax=uncultured Clostridium sp. TaxID=59620 RepID=UPI0026F3BC33|nr:DUF3892 domain-containing protein [uncultured Clostridium sp.]
MEDLRIVAVKKESGEISEYKLSDGRIIGREVAFQMVLDKQLKGYIPAVSKTGEAYIRSGADGDLSNNLQNLPEFE